jgi:hypothetical protein
MEKKGVSERKNQSELCPENLANGNFKKLPQTGRQIAKYFMYLISRQPALYVL